MKMNESQVSDSRLYPQWPRVGVHVLVFKEGQMLLVKRGGEPYKGKWGIPGGQVELGETVYEAAKRELLEECSIEIEIERVLDIEDLIIRDENNRIQYHIIGIYLLAQYRSGDVRAQSDAADVRWFATDELDELDITPPSRNMLNRTMPF